MDFFCDREGGDETYEIYTSKHLYNAFKISIAWRKKKDLQQAEERSLNPADYNQIVDIAPVARPPVLSRNFSSLPSNQPSKESKAQSQPDQQAGGPLLE